MRRRKLVILLAALIFGLAACAKPAEPSPVAVSSVLALSSEQSAPAQTPEGQEKPAEPEHEWTQEDIRRMYQNIQEPDWVFIDCLVTPDRANGCVGAALYWDGKGPRLCASLTKTDIPTAQDLWQKRRRTRTLPISETAR